MSRRDRFLKACRKEPADCTPIWLMRQAGRYMEEYRRLRRKHSFLEMCKTPELAAEVTLQPVRRFEVDAAIIFADILLPLEPMGVGLTFTDGKGPTMARRIRTRGDVEGLRAFAPEEEMAYLLDALALVRRELSGTAPLIGFCGAPFTLASYLIEGGGSKDYVATKSFIYSDPEAFRLLMEKLTDMTIRYGNAQVRYGAEALQIFDSWVGVLSAVDYREFVLPYMTRLFSDLDPSVPRIHFAVNGSHLLSLLTEAGGDVIGVDWRTPLDEAWRQIGYGRAIQGNLDPVALFGAKEQLRGRVSDILQRASGRPGHIFNLGHGILPATPVENVAFLIDLVHGEEDRS